MSDFESMRKKHRKDSIITLTFFLFLLIIFIFHTHYILGVRKLLDDPSTFNVVLKKSWYVLIFTIIAPIVTYFFGVFTIAKRDFYYNIDNWFFRKRLNVDKYICAQMLAFKIAITEEHINKLSILKEKISDEKTRKKIMSYFYLYIEKEDVVNPDLKKHAFIYWGDYFSHIMYIFWGIISLMVVLGLLMYDQSITPLRGVIFVIILLTIFLNLHSALWGKTAQKLYEIPETQTKQIQHNAGQSFLNDLVNERFFLENEE